jgi:hypothetical protein
VLTVSEHRSIHAKRRYESPHDEFGEYWKWHHRFVHSRWYVDSTVSDCD